MKESGVKTKKEQEITQRNINYDRIIIVKIRTLIETAIGINRRNACCRNMLV